MTRRKKPVARRPIKVFNAKVNARLRARKLAQDRIDQSTASSIGMGPLSFNSELARLHGWTNAEIYRFWDRIIPIYKRVSNRTTKRHPERYKTVAGTVIYIGKVPER